MKKFISMLAGVVMASSLFAVSAYAAGNVAFSIDKTEDVKVGDVVTITIDSLEKNVSTDAFNVKFDTTKFKVVDILDSYGTSVNDVDNYYPFLEYKRGNRKSELTFMSSTIDEANGGTVAFGGANTDTYLVYEMLGFASIQFEAIADGDAAFTLNEKSAGTGKYEGLCDTINVTVKGNEPVTPPAPVVTWKEADASWVAPEGKKAIWWPFDYEANTFPGHVFVEVTDGTRTETIGIGTDAAYDVNGAVSFAVAVILDAEVDATNFDCVVK